MLRKRYEGELQGAACDGLLTAMGQLVILDNAAAQYSPDRIGFPLQDLENEAFSETRALLDSVQTPDITPELLEDTQSLLQSELSRSAPLIMSQLIIERLICGRREEVAKVAKEHAAKLYRVRVIPHTDNIALIGGPLLSAYGQSMQPAPVTAGEAIDISVHAEHPIIPIARPCNERFFRYSGYSINGYPIRNRKRARIPHWFSLISKDGLPQVDLLPIK